MPPCQGYVDEYPIQQLVLREFISQRSAAGSAGQTG